MTCSFEIQPRRGGHFWCDSGDVVWRRLGGKVGLYSADISMGLHQTPRCGTSHDAEAHAETDRLHQRRIRPILSFPAPATMPQGEFFWWHFGEVRGNAEFRHNLLAQLHPPSVQTFAEMLFLVAWLLRPATVPRLLTQREVNVLDVC